MSQEIVAQSLPQISPIPKRKENSWLASAARIG
jgi:hypothetical protein